MTLGYARSFGLSKHPKAENYLNGFKTKAHQNIKDPKASYSFTIVY